MSLLRSTSLLTMMGAACVLSLPALAKSNVEQEIVKWQGEVGLGYDSNMFRTHSGSYTDFYPATPVAVTPNVQSGFYVPYKMALTYTEVKDKDQSLIVEGKFSGEQYFGHSNANEYDYGGKIGLLTQFATKGKLEDTLYVGLSIGSRKKVYVDRDTGGAKTTVAGADISNRYNYTVAGIESEYRVETGGDIRYGVNGLMEDRTYADPVVVSKYSHLYTRLGADVEYIPEKGSLFKLAYSYELSDFSARHARDINGTYSSVANPLLKYTDHNYKFYWRKHVNLPLVVYLDFDLTSHSDAFVNYTGYTETDYGTRVLYNPKENWKARLSLSRWKRNYSNAFAYDNPAQPRLTSDGLTLKLKGEYELAKDMSAWAELERRSWNTNDLRYDYSRTQIMCGVSIEN